MLSRPHEARLIAYIVPTTQHPTNGEHPTASSRRAPPRVYASGGLRGPGSLAARCEREGRTAIAPRSQGATTASGDPIRVPRTPFEERLAALWSEVLQLDHVGIHDHFLELGGDSLRATQPWRGCWTRFSSPYRCVHFWKLRQLQKWPSCSWSIRRTLSTRTSSPGCSPTWKPSTKPRRLPLLRVLRRRRDVSHLY